MAYGDFKDLPRRKAFDKVLCGKAFNIAKIRKYAGYLRGLASMVYSFFWLKVSATRLRTKILTTQNKFAGGAVTHEQSEILATQDKSAIENKIRIKNKN